MIRTSGASSFQSSSANLLRAVLLRGTIGTTRIVAVHAQFPFINTVKYGEL